MPSDLPDLPIAQVRHFLLVAEHGGFHAAAEKAFRTQPAISKSVQALEERLGGALLEPSRRSVLTPLGRQCLPYLRELVLHHDRSASTALAFATWSAWCWRRRWTSAWAAWCRERRSSCSIR